LEICDNLQTMEIQYTKRLEKIEAQIRSWLPENPDSEWIKKVFNISDENINPALVKNLSLPGWDLINRGGKRWRPLLMLLTAEAIAGERGAEAALPLTPLVEFPHTASLIHDDIEDNSDERRGKPAAHLLYGTDTAINGGSFMYFLPLACLSACGSAVLKDRVLTAWADHMRALHLGQAMDIAWHRDFHSLPGLDEYDSMCRLKTGCLASLAAVLGVYAGTAPARQKPAAVDSWKKTALLAEAFGNAAEQLGVGFQILDDVKNLSIGVPGKKRGDDIVEGKKSLPVLLYLHRYPEKRDFASRCFAAARAGGVTASEVDELISELEKAGVLEEGREKALEYINKSREVFSAEEAAGFSLKKEGRELLAGLVDLII
jgi:octaprenyl-diphosphate synthase